VTSRKFLVDGRAASRYRLTRAGRRAFSNYLKQIEDLLGGLEP
jgi:hypothetical protein